MTSLLRTMDFLPLRQAMDRLFEQAFATFPLWADVRQGYHVPVDIYEDHERYVIRAILPGVKPEDVELTCHEGTVILAGKARPWATDGLEPIVREIGDVAFRREIRLPSDVDAAKAEATYEHGVLTLTLPKAEAAVSKRIPVKVPQAMAA